MNDKISSRGATPSRITKATAIEIDVAKAEDFRKAHEAGAEHYADVRVTVGDEAVEMTLDEFTRRVFARSESVRNEWRDLAHEAFLQLEYLHQRERQHGSTGAILLRLSEKLGLPLDTPVSATAPNVAAYTDRIGELEEILQELVTLKAMHDEIERIKPKDLSGPRNYRAEEMEEDYQNRKPKAWQRARESLE